jgi:hypothetical protein
LYGSAVPGGLVEEDRNPTAKAVGYWRSRKVSRKLKSDNLL